MWYSKDDVLKDLAECTGVRMNNFDEEYLVSGSKPPPPPKPHVNEDDEMQLRFGGYGDQLPFNDSEKYGPDLVGITELLRMVDTFDSPQDACQPPSTSGMSPTKHIRSKKETSIVIIKPQKTCHSPRSKCELKEAEVNNKSKLNPNVEEFVPKSLEIKRAVVDNVNGNSNEIIENRTVVDKNIINDEINQQIPVQSNNSDGSNEEIEKQKIIALLKSKISARSKENTLEKKREKNVAMAALLRLNSGPAASPSNTTSSSTTPKCSSPITNFNTQPEPTEYPKINVSPLVLNTPDYYAGPLYSPTVLNVDDSEHNIPEPKPPLETPLKTPSPRELKNPQIKESVDKVNNWLNSPEKKPKVNLLVPHMGPVIFKKKESISPRSPCSEVVHKEEPFDPIPSFDPSQNAADLAKNWKARVKAKEEKAKKEQPPLDIWTKLEIDLKAKDEIIKKRLNQADSPPSTDNS